MRVKIFKDENTCNLEEKINDFLKRIDPRSVIDIKYTAAGTQYSVDCYSAMIILQNES